MEVHSHHEHISTVCAPMASTVLPDKADNQAASRDRLLSASSPLPSKCFFPRIMHRRRLSILNSPNTHITHLSLPLPPLSASPANQHHRHLCCCCHFWPSTTRIHSACSQRETSIIRCTCAPATQTLVLSLPLPCCFCCVSLRPATPASPKELHPSSQPSTTNDLLTRRGRMWPKGRLHSSIAWRPCLPCQSSLRLSALPPRTFALVCLISLIHPSAETLSVATVGILLSSPRNPLLHMTSPSHPSRAYSPTCIPAYSGADATCTLRASRYGRRACQPLAFPSLISAVSFPLSSSLASSYPSPISCCCFSIPVAHPSTTSVLHTIQPWWYIFHFTTSPSRPSSQ